MPYRTFAVYNAVSGIVWGVGYCLLGYLAGSAYTVVEREVGTGFAIAIAALVVAALMVWAVRRHRRGPESAVKAPVPAENAPALAGNAAESGRNPPALPEKSALADQPAQAGQPALADEPTLAENPEGGADP
jgi:hypothetical protein